ncbi:PREDICTED: LEAF RUST 10 DISEASE-RESISTANCE LOCUS RECEPTOR-LIKE PROTEIN KINASE-like 2.5 [Prunus mume]|uniref:LEAF RUST 10 DISEASE-RESISTANCE LOCUS RECEPTOR-LIKE PROTEIN KINASE-like 2.5 n=1 Tax=Prunus mume TaxID=102107 RepID=A0ABM0NST1_PRUMU|nr:PREDICTED: LEAF RUST 10 DISEASE-RESISTANCE LOCUS RECEPTOR-LIKE PROTEIN KINASE-like 2.5 [Prunus mume]
MRNLTSPVGNGGRRREFERLEVPVKSCDVSAFSGETQGFQELCWPGKREEKVVVRMGPVSRVEVAGRDGCEGFSGSARPLQKVLTFSTVEGLAVGGFSVMVIILCICILWKQKMVLFVKKDKRDEFDVKAFIRNYGSLTPKRYTYANVKKMTDSFIDKLGKSGYGIVYKGRLPDGLLVAVKVLSESKGNGEDFVNEVASIGRTSHVNIVTLSGFCYEEDKRALIYEYMPNGSLDNFIHKYRSRMANFLLEWKTLSEIAVGIA